MSEDFDYGEACPVSMASAILCERWTLQIIREMFLGSTKYSQFQRYMPNISPTLLKNRLRTLEEHNIIMRKKAGAQGRYDYYLTPSGKALGPVLTEMGKWGMQFARAGMTDKQNTVHGLMRDLTGALDVAELPTCDTTIQFKFTDEQEQPKQYIYIKDGDAQSCSQDLGFDVDVYITSSINIMTKVWYGEIPMKQAINNEQIHVVGNTQFTQTITKWLKISGFTGDNPHFIAPD